MREPPLTDACLAAALAPEGERDPTPVPFFRAPALDALTRAHPASPYLLFGPAIAWILAAPAAPAAPARLALIAAGWLAWTLLEYWLHRAIFHLPGDTPARKVARFILHTHHHRAPGDRRRLVATPFQGLSLALLLLGLDRLLAGADAWRPLLAGQLLGYLFYEAAHYRAHHARRARWLGAGLRRHHLRHHAEGAGNYGISCPLWDLVFRTAIPRTPAPPRPGEARGARAPGPG